MKHLDENERILTVFGAFVTVVAVALSINAEVSARREIAAHKRDASTPAPGIVQQAHPVAIAERHIGYAQETLNTRWDFPDGHATLGVGFGLFGLILIAVPRSVARKRVSGSIEKPSS